MADYASSPIITGATGVSGTYDMSNVAQLSDGSLVYIALPNGTLSTHINYMYVFRSTDNGQNYSIYCKLRPNTGNSTIGNVMISARGMKIAITGSWFGQVTFLTGMDFSIVPQGTVKDDLQNGGTGFWTWRQIGYSEDSSRAWAILYASDENVYLIWNTFHNYSEDDQYYYYVGSYPYGSTSTTFQIRANPQSIYQFMELPLSIAEYKGRVVFSRPIYDSGGNQRFLTVPLGTATIEYHTYSITGGYTLGTPVALLPHPLNGNLYLVTMNNTWEFRLYRTSDVAAVNIVFDQPAGSAIYTATTAGGWIHGAQMSPLGEVWVFGSQQTQSTASGIHATVVDSATGTVTANQWHIVSNPSGNYAVENTGKRYWNSFQSSPRTVIAVAQGYPPSYGQHRTWTRTYNNPPNPPTNLYIANQIVSPDGTVVWVKEKRPTLNWTFSDPDAGNWQTQYEVAVSNDNFATWFTTSGQVTSGSQWWTCGVDLPDGVYQFAVRTWDNSGASAQSPADPWAYMWTVVIDTTPPSGVSVNVPQYLNQASGTYKVWAYGVSDHGAGINRVQFPTCNVTLTGGATWIWFDGVRDGATNNWYCDIPLSSFGNAEGSYYTDPYIYDNAGNQGNLPRIYTWIDRSKPAATTPQTNGVLYATSNGVTWPAFSDGAATSGLLLTTLYLQKYNGSTWVNEPGFPKSVAGLTYSFTGLTPGTQYRWGVTYTDNASNVSTLNYTTFTTNTYAVSTITNLSSSGSTLNQKPAIRFTATDANDATLSNFQVQVSTVNTFTSTVLDATSGSSMIGWLSGSLASGGTNRYTPQSNLGTGTFFVRARAYDGKEWGTWSTTIQFTIQATTWATTVAASDTAISKRTIDDLRTKVNAVRQARGLATAVWTDSVIKDWNTVGSTDVRATHLIELRQAVTDIYSALSLVPPTWATDSIVDSTKDRKGQHWIELRNALAAA